MKRTRIFVFILALLCVALAARAQEDSPQKLNQPPRGFAALLNGTDLAGWKGLVADPVKRAKMAPEELAAAQAKADQQMRAHWRVVDGALEFDGSPFGSHLCTIKDYQDFELRADWKIGPRGDSGIYLRGSPQVQIWDTAQWPEGSGGLYNNKQNPAQPLLVADNPIGQWNTFRIVMRDNLVSVWLNGKLVVDNTILENYWDRKIPIFPTGQIELQSHGSKLYFRNIYLRELPSQNLFNGKDLAGWAPVGGKGAWQAGEGLLRTSGKGGGWLSTDKEYGNFQLSLEYKVPEGGNSGVFIRAPRQGDPAYTGMEIQILDDYAPKWANLKPEQYTGSIYGVVAAQPRVTKKADEWQKMIVLADGRKVRVCLNDRSVIDAELDKYLTAEFANHPGLKNAQGFIGLQTHDAPVEFRNLRLWEIK